MEKKLKFLTVYFIRISTNKHLHIKIKNVILQSESLPNSKCIVTNILPEY